MHLKFQHENKKVLPKARLFSEYKPKYNFRDKSSCFMCCQWRKMIHSTLQQRKQIKQILKLITNYRNNFAIL